MFYLPPLVATVPTNHLSLYSSPVLTFDALVFRSFYQNHHSIQNLLRLEAIRSNLVVPLIRLPVAVPTPLAARRLKHQQQLKLLHQRKHQQQLKLLQLKHHQQLKHQQVPLEERLILKIILEFLLKVFTV